MKMIDKLIFKISFVANFALLLFGIWDRFCHTSANGTAEG